MDKSHMVKRGTRMIVHRGEECERGGGGGGRGRRKGKDVVSSFLLSFYVGKSEKGTTDGPPFMLISGFSLFFPMLFYFGIPN